MSLITVSSESADIFTVSRYSRCSACQLGVQRQVGHADDAVHRSANFVAHVGQELALRAVGRFGGFFGPLQIRLRLFAVGNIDVYAYDPADISVFIEDHSLSGSHVPDGAVTPNDAELNRRPPLGLHNLLQSGLGRRQIIRVNRGTPLLVGIRRIECKTVNLSHRGVPRHSAVRHIPFPHAQRRDFRCE